MQADVEPQSLSRVLDELDAFLAQQPQVSAIELFSVDINGIPRSRQLPQSAARMLYQRGLAGPGSTALMNSLGEPCHALGIGTNDGDPDHWLQPVPGSLVPVPWLKGVQAQVLCSWYQSDGNPLLWDPRHRLQAVVERFAAQGLTPVLALELEFYLLADGVGTTAQPRLPRVRGTVLEQPGAQYAAAEDLWDHDAFLADVRTACAQQGIPATTVHSEYAPGQFEINVQHVPDALRACDHAVMLKRLIKGLARQHGMAATFMAKPFAELAGSGMHVHLSLRDAQGRALFASAVPGLRASALEHAMAGVLASLAEGQWLSVPNANSYRRLHGGSFAPTHADWADNRRSAALRLPLGDPQDPRVEHRVAGADANPYLVAAAVLAGVHHGLEQQLALPLPGREEARPLPGSWQEALAVAAQASVLPHYLEPTFWRLLLAVRSDECLRYNAQVPDVDYRWYLRNA